MIFIFSIPFQFPEYGIQFSASVGSIRKTFFTEVGPLLSTFPYPSENENCNLSLQTENTTVSHDVRVLWFNCTGSVASTSSWSTFKF